MGRHEQREQLFKLLFRVEFNSLEDMPEQIKLFFQDEEIEYTEKAMNAISDKYDKIQEKLPEIDKLLDEKVEGWNTSPPPPPPPTVLRIAVFEMMFDDDVPATVAINEAIEIAKVYGQETSGGFVNAVLAKFVNKQG